MLPVKEAMAKNFFGAGAKTPVALGADLNETPAVFAQLEALGLERGRPTLVVSEAVLFYLSPPAKEALLRDAGASCVDLQQATGLTVQQTFTGLESDLDMVVKLGYFEVTTAVIAMATSMRTDCGVAVPRLARPSRCLPLCRHTIRLPRH